MESVDDSVCATMICVNQMCELATGAEACGPCQECDLETLDCVDMCIGDECCCDDDESCSADCCPDLCKQDEDCPKGHCCCKNGSCDAKCCDGGLRPRNRRHRHLPLKYLIPSFRRYQILELEALLTAAERWRDWPWPVEWLPGQRRSCEVLPWIRLPIRPSNSPERNCLLRSTAEAAACDPAGVMLRVQNPSLHCDRSPFRLPGILQGILRFEDSFPLLWLCTMQMSTGVSMTDHRSIHSV